MLQVGDGNGSGGRRNPLAGKRVFIPPMAYGSGRTFAAAFHALGLEADITPPSDNRTRELGARYTSGDECYPAKVTVGDFMKVLEQPEIDPAKVVLFMPTADGPCRFGQYAPYLRSILEENGYPHTSVISPSSHDGYADFGDLARQFVRTAWRALIAADILQKVLLQHRPYEAEKGGTEAVYEECLVDVCQTIEKAPLEPGTQLKAMREAMVRSRDRFRALPVRRNRSTPLIGIVGEIFCRLHCFSNEDLVRRLEEYEAEAWISDITEWVWYTISEQFRKLHLVGRQYSLDAFKAWIRKRVQKHDEHVLLEPFRDDFVGYEEPPVEEVLAAARPYLPADGAGRDGAQRRQGDLPGQEGRGRDHRHQPVHLYERDCVRGGLSEGVAGFRRDSDSQLLL